MLRYIILLSLFTISSSKSVIFNDKYLILRQDCSEILCIDRTSGDKIFIPLEDMFEEITKDGFKYKTIERKKIVRITDLNTRISKDILLPSIPKNLVLSNNLLYCSTLDSLVVIDVQSSSIIRTMNLGGITPTGTVIKNDLAYIYDYLNEMFIILDLKDYTIIGAVPFGLHTDCFFHNNLLYRPGKRFSDDVYCGRLIRHEDTIYVSHSEAGYVSVVDLLTLKTKATINVGAMPQPIIIHGDFGYVVNRDSNNLSVIDLKTNTVTQTIAVGRSPRSIAFYGGFGYVVNYGSADVSVIDLTTNTVTDPIPVGEHPRSMVIHRDIGYVMNYKSKNVSVIDLKSNTVIATLKNPKGLDVDCSDTHVYLGINEVGPHYPTLDSLMKLKAENKLSEFASMNPNAFKVGEVKPRDYPVEENQFDRLPPYVLAQEIFWDLATNKPIIGPVDILATLITMKYPQKFLQSEPVGPWLRNRLHLAFFQAVWTGRTKKAQAMLRYFIQLKDPVMIKLATYTMAKPAGTLTGATNSTSK